MLRAGKVSAAFEERFGKMTGAGYALTCANGTCALQLAYEPLIQPGDEVLVPAWSFIATVSMVVARGGVPVFCDADPGTYCIDVEDAAAQVTPRTRAIVATHLYGNVADIAAIERLAAKHALAVVYDAAQAHLATYGGRGIGAYGDAVTYSFYATKNISTGEGGMVTTNSADLAKRMALLRSHGETGKYLHESVGYNYRMTDVEAAIGLSQLGRAEAITRKRRENAAALTRMIAGIDGLTPPAETPGSEHVYHLYTVRMDPGRFSCTRDEFVRALEAEGVQCAVHYPRSLAMQPAFARWAKEEPPVCAELARSVFCVPVHHNLSDGDLKAIGEALAKVAGAYSAR
jgi:perosamine synthetase